MFSGTIIYDHIECEVSSCWTEHGKIQYLLIDQDGEEYYFSQKWLQTKWNEGEIKIVKQTNKK